jgi:hypothetical protein
MNWTRFVDIMMKFVVVGAVFAAGFLINGATMGIALGSGVGVAVFAADRSTRWCWPRRAHHPRND